MKVNSVEILLLGKTVHCALKTLHVFPTTASLSQKLLTSSSKAAVVKSLVNFKSHMITTREIL